MSRLFYHVMQDNVGNLLFDVAGTMRVAGSATLATIYGDEALTVILPNPMTNHPSFGSFKCFLGAGDYDFHMAKAGYTFETLTGVQGHGTMAQQDASAVSITGGQATFGRLGVNTAVDPTYHLAMQGDMLQTSGNVRLERLALNTAPDLAYRLAVSGPVIVTGGETRLQRLGLNRAPAGDVALHLAYVKASEYGLVVAPTGGDTGNAAVVFNNAAGAVVGTITTTGAATAYNTSSDGRLKEAVEPLRDALATIQALRPVAFRWKADGTGGRGLVAQDVLAVVPEVVSGTPESALPLGIDYSKLVPYLIGACQALSQQVEGLTARLAGLEAQASGSG